MSEVAFIYPWEEYRKPVSRKDQRKAKKVAKNPARQAIDDETPQDMEEICSFLYSSCTGTSDLEDAILRLREMSTLITCIEPVLNRALWKRFQSKVAELKGETSSVEIRVAFHGTKGTKESNIAKIVKDGFLVPGSATDETGARHRSQRGATWGLGIHCTPRVETTLSYGAERIIMCTVILGKVYRCPKDFSQYRYQPPKA